MLTIIRQIHDALGRPALDTREAANQFTATVAAMLHFGFPAYGIAADPVWGRRRNKTGPLSDDTLKRRDTGETWDYIRNAGSEDWELVWAPAHPGVRWEAPLREDLPTTLFPPADPPVEPPTGDDDALREIRQRLINIEQILTKVFRV